MIEYEFFCCQDPESLPMADKGRKKDHSRTPRTRMAGQGRFQSFTVHILKVIIDCSKRDPSILMAYYNPHITG